MPDFKRICRVDGTASDELEELSQDRIEGSMQRARSRIARAVEDAGGELTRGDFAQLLRALRLWDDLPEPIRRKVRPHPAFRYFIHGIHRSQDPADLLRFARHLPQLIWAAGLEHRKAWAGAVRLDHRGGLRAPGFARHLEFGEKRAFEQASLHLAEDRAVFSFKDGLIVQVTPDDVIGWPQDAPSLEEHGYELTLCSRVGRIGLPVDTRDPWLRVQLTGSNQRADGVSFEARDDERYVDLPATTHIQEAFDIIDEVWPDEVDDIGKHVHALVPFMAPPHAHSAFTVSSRQGAIFIGDAPALAASEYIVHEAAHVKLRQIQLLDSLLLEPLDESILVRVPWRRDPRPMPGVFEGVFVFTHVAELMRRLAHEGNPDAAARYLGLRGDLKCGVDLVQAHANLTEAGHEFFSELADWALELAN